MHWHSRKKLSRPGILDPSLLCCIPHPADEVRGVDEQLTGSAEAFLRL